MVGGSAGTNQCLFFLADLHALSMPHSPKELRRGTLEMAAALVACGIDPERSILFNQAQVPAHAELQWLLNGTARMGWLNRMTQFKDKSGKNREGASVALFSYPVLQAADVLLYQATHVPVGEDQKQHLELARDIAQKFNNDFAGTIARAGYDGGFFPLPEPLITGPATRVMSLRDGSKKMSKSEESDMTRINLTDDADLIAKKIRKAKTDPEPLPSEVKGLESRPEAENLVGIYAGLGDTTKEAVLREFGNAPFSKFKEALAELAAARLTPIGTEMRRLMADPVEIDRILAEGARRAHGIADPILAKTKDIVGFIRS
jgi:tryptophanyl-tRNA synthetase